MMEAVALIAGSIALVMLGMGNFEGRVQEQEAHWIAFVRG